MKFWLTFLMVTFLLTTTACSVAAPETPTATTPASAASAVKVTTEPGAISTPETAPEPTEKVVAASQAEGSDWLTVEGTTTDNLTYLGNPDAPVTIIDYSDFLCSTCRSFVLKTEPQLREKYIKTGQVKLIFSAIVDFGDGSLQAHQAALCAREQGKFWPMHDLLYENQGSLFRGNVQETLKKLAAQLPLNPQEFNTCLDEQRTAALVQSQDEHRRQLGLRTRPTFDLNGQLIVGAQPFEVFQNAIESLLGQE